MAYGYRLAIDTGGTFTDVALMREDAKNIWVIKVPSTPKEPNKAVVEGMKGIKEKASVGADAINFFLHGTTVATNSLLEKQGAKAALITTRGFRDVLLIGRQERPDIYNNYIKRPEPLIPRNYRFEVDERINKDGKVLNEIDSKEVKKLLGIIKKEKIESLAICLLHSYINPQNENKIKSILRQEGYNGHITLSSEILREFREYERMSTTVVNAFVMPIMSRYIDELENELSNMEINSSLYIMQSNGGVITSSSAKEFSARTILSGPAGGALGSVFVSKTIDRPNLISLDVGGTSADISLISGGKPEFTTESSIEGYPIKLPMIDINTIGAGGGSIAWIDAGGALRVGPKSAGAQPGPVCYDQGGEEPTVTDANLILGRINPNYLLGGQMEINIEKSKEVVRQKIAEPLNLTIEEAAKGVLEVINANMIRGMRVVSIEKGYDPREFSLIAFGGAGPLHASKLAKEMDINEVIIPINPGISSAIGMLSANVRHDYVKTFVNRISQVSLDNLKEEYRFLTEKAISSLQEENFSEEEINLQYFADLRYCKQAYEITIPISMPVDSKTLNELQNNFHTLHKQNYGYNRKGEDEIEFVNLRLVGYGLLPELQIPKENKISEIKVNSDISRQVYFNGEYHLTDIFNRDKLNVGNVIDGPAIIEQMDSTIVILPDQKGTIDSFKNVVIKVNSI